MWVCVLPWPLELHKTDCCGKLRKPSNIAKRVFMVKKVFLWYGGIALFFFFAFIRHQSLRTKCTNHSWRQPFLHPSPSKWDLSGGDFTRITVYVLHCKQLQITNALCRYFRNIVFILQKNFRGNAACATHATCLWGRKLQTRARSVFCQSNNLDSKHCLFFAVKLQI